MIATDISLTELYRQQLEQVNIERMQFSMNLKAVIKNDPESDTVIWLRRMIRQCDHEIEALSKQLGKA